MPNEEVLYTDGRAVIFRYIIRNENIIRHGYYSIPKGHTKIEAGFNFMGNKYGESIEFIPQRLDL